MWSAKHNPGVYYLDNVLVNHEALIFRRARILPESFTARIYEARFRKQRRPGWFLIKNYGLRRGATHVASGLWVIDNFSPDNYHHWLVDVLPRVVIGEALYPEERSVLLPRYYRRQTYVEFTLQVLGLLDEVRWISPREKVLVRHLAYVPRPSIYIGDVISEVARRISAAVEPRTGSRRLYFSRADAGRRRARNEDEVIKVLRAHDFEVMQIDPRRPWEQIQASASAEVIAGVHGAALSNLIFMGEGGRLLELRHDRDRYFITAYVALAEAVGVEYLAQTCQPAEEASEWAINYADLIVDLDLLREKLSLLGS